MREVQRTAEFRRIISLPRRDWRANADLVDGLTEYLRLPSGTMRLRAEQAIALCEAHDARGLFFQGEVGIGKTLVSLLLGTLLDADRAMLVIPAGLRQKTVDEFREYLRHWRAKPPRIESYEKLSVDSGKTILESYLGSAERPLLILDEAQKVKNPRSAAARRIDRLVEAHRDRLVVVAMSGTLAKRSIKDLAHILEWCVKSTPLPGHWSDLYEWSCAVDEKVPEASRIAPGVLLSLPGAVGNDNDIDRARRGVGERIFSTPGCVGVDAPARATSLAVESVHVPLSVAEDEAFRALRERWETPDGRPIADAVALWRHARELACGFWMRWDPFPPRSWLEPRKEWASRCREYLQNTHRELDTEFQVAEEICLDPRHRLRKVWEAWAAVRDSFVPNPVAEWVGDTALNFALRWAEREGEGIVWTEHVPFGRRLAERGMPYHGRAGLTDTGLYIERARGVVAASIHANATGRNLQRWHRGLITSCRGTGLLWEQLLGRQDRSGQTRDVKFDVVLSCREQAASLEQARRDANFHADLLTSRPRLRYANFHEAILPTVGWAWQ